MSKLQGKRTSKNSRGRPSRAVASAKALAALAVDPASVDPRAILAKIAADTSAPATARVAACRALLHGGLDGARKQAGTEKRDPVTDLALKLLKGIKK